jgi:hypothetical protein
MCPVCAANAAIVVAGVGSTGGFTSLAVRIFKWRKSARSVRSRPTPQLGHRQPHVASHAVQR